MRDLGGVIVCGGRSSRMGRPKAWLPFGDEPLLARVVRRIDSVARPVVVVAAPSQQLPPLPRDVIVARDPIEGRGPLQGIAVGLRTIEPHARFAFVSSTDAPFLVPTFIKRMRALCEGFDVAVPLVDGYHQPLAAVYASAVHSVAQSLLDRDKRRPVMLFDEVASNVVPGAVIVDDDAMRSADPELWSLRNVNTPEEYEEALRDFETLKAR